MKEKNFISIVAYVRNDQDNVEKFLKKINEFVSSKFLKYEIIFVNDDSTDDTLKIIKNYAKKIDNTSISVINMSFYHGKEPAMIAGTDIAIGDFVYQFDNVILDYDINLIFDVYKKSLEGFDIVNASYRGRRKFTSALFYKIFNKYSNYQYKIDTDTFRIVSRRAINRMNAINRSIPYRKAIEASAGLKITRLYYDKTIKYNHKSNKLIRKEREKNALDSLILFTDISYKASITLTLIMFLIAIVAGIYTVYTFILKNPIEGWTTTMLFLSFAFACVFLLFAIIIKYLSILINLNFKKMYYLVESIEKVN